MRFRKMKLSPPLGGTELVGVAKNATKSSAPYYLRLVTTSSYIQVLYFGNVISQTCKNVVAEVFILFRKKYISFITTYFELHQLYLQLQLKALDYTCFDCIQGINKNEMNVSHGNAQSFTNGVYG